jgi:pathogenesis-related protein 1
VPGASTIHGTHRAAEEVAVIQKTMVPLALAAGLAAAACGSPSEPVGPVAGPPPGFATDILAAQNTVRASASPTPVPALAPFSWSDAAASVAQAWANGCAYGHDSGRGNYGENIAASSPPGYLGVTALVGLWAAEAADYDYATNTCSAVCGHYTQIVWRDTVAAGCGMATCPASTSPFGNGKDWDFLVCDYSPPGNVMGQWPY